MAAESRSLVTGANRGLGLEFVRQLLARGDRVIAGCRRPGEATALNRLAGEFPGHLHVLPLDIRNERSRAAFASEAAGLHDGLELLVNNAAVLHTGERFGELQADVLTDTLATNTVGPWLLAQALAPLLARGTRPRIANISSEMGSIGETREVRSPSYAISKAAMNMASVLLARALNPQGIGVLTFNPGWVRTDMGGDGARLDVGESVRDLIALIDRRPGVPAGDFLDHDGRPLPW
jgi:NAD(P)-dependent dehydrogenase (short-subunit alcohol dehydrogenase family)